MLVLAVLALCQACKSRASVQGPMAQCRDSLPAISIPACTILIQSGSGGDAHALAEAYRNRGIAYKTLQQYERAIEDYGQAVKIDPGFALAYNSLGVAHQLEGKFDLAVSDYDQAVKARPDLAIAIHNRANAQFYLGRFDLAAADLERVLRLQPSATYVVIWLHVARARLGQDDTREFAAALARTDSVHWPAPVARLYLGRLTPDELLAQSVHTDIKGFEDQRCESQFYIGEYELMQHRREQAIERFNATLPTCPKEFTEYQGALAELRRLQPASSNVVTTPRQGLP